MEIALWSLGFCQSGGEEKEKVKEKREEGKKRWRCGDLVVFWWRGDGEDICDGV